MMLTREPSQNGEPTSMERTFYFAFAVSDINALIDEAFEACGYTGSYKFGADKISGNAYYSGSEYTITIQFNTGNVATLPSQANKPQADDYAVNINAAPLSISNVGRDIENLPIDSEPKINVNQYYEKQIKRLKNTNPPIEIVLDEKSSQYIYYDNSNLLKMLEYFPYFQLSVIALFLTLVIWALSTDKRAEQDKLWAGLSKETAHQLGTPISSLMAWNEILKTKLGNNDMIVAEIDKDVERLKTITERFSKIGSIPELSEQDISQITAQSVEYMLNRTSKKITYSIDDSSTEHTCLISTPLFEWVIENLCKNAIDAMEGKEGTIDFELFNLEDSLIIEITDSGRGIERNKFKSIFEPGYTTKQRGWGLGLSLAKRIIEEYHHGKIFVKSSELGLGTTFRIELPTTK